MCETGILDGDCVVVEQRAHANNGESVVALIRGDEATLKWIAQASERVLPCPEHSALESMELYLQDVVIQGVLVGQMRWYR